MKKLFIKLEIFSFSCPYLSTELNPAIPIVDAVIFFFLIIFLFRTSWSDPGIIPRPSADEVSYMEKLTGISLFIKNF